MELALNIAARRCNLPLIERDQIRAGRIEVVHAKGGNTASIRLLPETRKAIDALAPAPIR